MKVFVTFFRTREKDDAHAVVGREGLEAASIDDAVAIARQLVQTLDMPQHPDAMVITDMSGVSVFSSIIDAEARHKFEIAENADGA